MSVTIDWGDGKTDEIEEVDGAKHTYDDGGEYVISVKRPDDVTAEAVRFEAVAPPPPPLELTATPDPQNGLLVRVTVTGGRAPYSFDFGDAGKKTFALQASDGEHTYATAGSYTIMAVDSASQAASGRTTFEAIDTRGDVPTLTAASPTSAQVGT